MTMTYEEKRDEIVTKIEAKRVAVEKLLAKPKSLNSQVEMYRESIEEYKRKIAALEERIAKFEASGAESQSTGEKRAEELQWMENILVRFDSALEESAKVAAQKYAMAENDSWKLGDDMALMGAYRKTPEWKALTARLDLLNAVIDNALPDVQKIYNSRGRVSVYHAQELGTDLPV